VTSRLVRPGTAEVVYQLHKDAVKAVDVYHNRQLDGQPMKCMLVNSRPPSIPGAARSSLRYLITKYIFRPCAVSVAVEVGRSLS
jgi:hypothetical protein